MIIQQKKSVEIFNPFVLKNIPECKRRESGIRPRCILKPSNHSFQEAIKRSLIINRNSQENIPSTRLYFKPGKFMIKNKKPPSGPIVHPPKQPNIAFFNFLPDLDNDKNSNSVKSSKRSKSTYRYGKISKYLRKFLGPRRSRIQSDGKKSERNCMELKIEQEEIDSDLMTPKKWTEDIGESGEEESPLRDYSNILKPRFNNL